MLDWRLSIQFTPERTLAQKIRAPFHISADKATWLVSGWRDRLAPHLLRRNAFIRRSSRAQAAPGVAAAEKIFVPKDGSILAGPANPAIVFRVRYLCGAGILPAVFEFENTERMPARRRRHENHSTPP
jgi:hypothetical protein